MSEDIKLQFVPHNRSVLKERVKWLNDPTVNRWFDSYRGKGTTLSKQRQWFAEYEKDKTRRLFTVVVNGEPIGAVGLTHIDKEHKQAELFIMIGERSWRGRGLGKKSVAYIVDYAFHRRKLHRIMLHVSSKNVAAVRCYEKSGFKLEGRLKEDRLIDGQYEDVLIMGLLND